MKGWLPFLVGMSVVSTWTSPAQGGWKSFTTADGLGVNQVRSILEDRSENLWFGTAGGGVSRYDGSTWRMFTMTDGLGANYVNAMVEDHSGNLWFGTSGGGVSRYDGTAWRTFTAADGLANNVVLSMLEDRSGNLWFGTSNSGVSRYDGTAWRTFTTADGLTNNLVLSILEDRSGNLWFGTSGGGVSRYSGTVWRTFTTADGLAGNVVQSMLEDRSGNLWFGTWEGVSRYDGVTWRNFTTSDGLASRYVNATLEDRAGNLWFGTSGGGVSRYDGTKWRSFATADGLNDIDVVSLLEDSSGNIWFGTGGGVSLYDGSAWRTFTTADGLGENYVQSVLEDRSGNLWFGTRGGGASRFDGSAWRTFTTADGLGENYVQSMLEDRSGNLWFGTLGGGVSRYDGTAWRTFTTDDGLVDNVVLCMLEDRSGTLWFGTFAGGVSRYDGTGWRTFTPDDGLADYLVESMLEDRSGNLWFGTPRGVSHYDGTGWRTFTAADGLAGDDLLSMLEDHSGSLWFGTPGGVSRYDGSNWRNFTTADGLADKDVVSMLEDHSGSLWFGTPGGVSRYEPDRVPPHTVFLSRPPQVTSARVLTAVFVAGFRENDRIEFSYRMDSSDSLAWSPWSQVSSWFSGDLQDGTHVLEARCRDFLTNTDRSPAKAVFEIDATPPGPVITAPLFGQPVRDRLEVRGTAADARFVRYRVDIRPEGASSWNSPDATLIHESSTPVLNGTLGALETRSLSDGGYDLRLSVTDSLGLTGTAQATPIVDNHFPFVDQTAPARVVAATGGDIYTTNAEAHLYFPPHAFREDAVATVAANDGTVVPDTLPTGAVRVLAGYELRWGPATLEKPARLELSLSGVTAVAGSPVVYASSDGTTWRRLGGTVEEEPGHRIALAVTESGRYAVFSEPAPPSTGSSTLSAVSFTPRVFSPSGTFADKEVGISFTLGRPSPVTVRVFNRAGRLVKEVATSVPLGAGSNLVRWDGTDRDGQIVGDGLYLVTVEALGHTERRPLAVVK